MNITLNGENISVDAKTLSELLDEKGYENAVVATAINGEFIPASNRGSTHLNANDMIEILAPMQGG